MKKGKYSVLIAGAGRMGQTHAGGYCRIPDVEIAAVFDQDIRRAEQFAGQFRCRPFADLAKALAYDIDFVDICLPTPIHKDAAICCLRQGKDVLCEKPLASSVGDAQAMADTARETDRILMSAQVVRFWPEYRLLADLVLRSEIREVQNLSFYRYGPQPQWSQNHWLLSDHLTGGIAYDLLIHDIDFIQWVWGPPEWVFARKSLIRPDYVGYMNILLGYRNMNVLVEGGFSLPEGYPFTAGFRLSTVEQALEYRNTDGRGLLHYGPSSSGEKIAVEDADPYAKEVAYFTDCVRQGRKPENCTPAEAVKTLKLVELICQSADRNEKCEVGQL